MPGNTSLVCVFFFFFCFVLFFWNFKFWVNFKFKTPHSKLKNSWNLMISNYTRLITAVFLVTVHPILGADLYTISLFILSSSVKPRHTYNLIWQCAFKSSCYIQLWTFTRNLVIYQFLSTHWHFTQRMLTEICSTSVEAIRNTLRNN